MNNHQLLDGICLCYEFGLADDVRAVRSGDGVWFVRLCQLLTGQPMCQAPGFVEAGLSGAGGCRLWLFVAVAVGCPGGFVLGRGFACRRRSVAGWCPYQCTHSAVATTGGVDVLPGSLVADQLGLVQGVQSLGQGVVIGVLLRLYRGDRLAVGQGLPVADGPVLHPTVGSDAPGQRDQPPDVSAARRPFSGRPGPGRCTLAGRWSASR